MKKEKADMVCPVCGKTENQVKAGINRSGTQRCFCKECKKYYTFNPKTREYPEQIREQAIKAYYAGASGRGVGKMFGFSKANVYNWIKKTTINVDNSPKIYELDELYWFIEKKPRTETRENVYLMTMVSREPRQIVGFDAATDKSPERIQKLVDSAPKAEQYCSDGWTGYVDVVYPGKYIRNVHDKSDTFTVEGVNADFRHYIPILRRRSRCFPRSIETLKVVVGLFVNAYNAFGVAKTKFRKNRTSNSRELPFSVLDFL